MIALVLAAWSALDEPALTPDDAVKLALARSGAVEAARLGGEKNAIHRSLVVDPVDLTFGHHSLDGFVTTPHTDSNGNAYAPLDDTYVSLGVKLPKPTDLAAQLGNEDAAKADAFDVDDASTQLATDVRSLHAQLRELREELVLAQSASTIMERLESQTGERLTAQATTALDARLATLRRIDAAADVEDMRSQVERADHKLAALLGKAAPLALAPGPRPLCEPPASALDVLLARAKERSPHLQALIALRTRASRAASLSWASYVPYVDGVGVGWYNQPLDKRDAVHAHIDFALPLFEPFTGRAGEAAIEEKRLDAIYTDSARQLEADVRSAYDKLNGSLSLVKLYAESKKSIDEGLADVEQALAAGQSDVFRVAEVQAQAVQAERNGLHARLRCETAAVDLARLTDDVRVPP